MNIFIGETSNWDKDITKIKVLSFDGELKLNNGIVLRDRHDQD